MSALDVALLAGPASAFAAVGAAVASLRRPGHEAWARRALVLAVATHAALLGWLAIAFLRTDLSVHYVWATTRAAYPWYYRLAGVWGGQEGTYLLWTTLAAAFVLLEDARRAGAPAANWPVARAVALGAVAVLSLAPALLGLGHATADFHLGGGGAFRYDPGGAGSTPLDIWPEGFGLNRLLVTPFMLVHPPLEFAAYAAVVLPFSYAVAHLARGGAWTDEAAPWLRHAWLLFVAALALGGLWAYYVLSFGGFWAWDPVETADLLPWIALTVALHGIHVAKKGANLGVIAPLAAAVPFVLVAFSTFVTRSGLWISVHAFLPVASVFLEPDPGARWVQAVHASRAAAFATGTLLAAGLVLLGALSRGAGRIARSRWDPVAGAFLVAAGAAFVAPGPAAAVAAGALRVLGAGRPVAGAVVLVLLLLLVAVAPLLRRRGPGLPLDPRDKGGQLVIATLLLGLALGTTTLLLLLSVNGSQRGVYDSRLPLLAAPLLAFSSIAYPLVKKGRWRWGLPVAAALAGGVLWALAPGWPRVPLSAAPLALVASAGSLRAIAERGEAGNPLRARVRAGLLAATGLLGLVHWCSPPTVIGVPGLAVATSAPLIVAGIAASLLVLLGLFLETRRGWPPWLTVVLGVAAWGYAAGAALALGAGALGRGPVVAPKPGPRKLGVPLIHVAMPLVVLGVAFAFYGAGSVAFTQAAPLERGVPQDVAGHTLTLVDGLGTDADGDGRYEKVQAIVEIARGDRVVGEAVLTMVWDVRGSVTQSGGYLPWDAPIHRTPFGDVYLNGDLANPLAMRVRDGAGNATWVVTGGATAPVDGAAVDAVALTTLWIPGVELVWGGIVAMLLGMLVRSRAPAHFWRDWWRAGAAPPPAGPR